MKLCQDRRGIQRNRNICRRHGIMLTYDLPLAEVIYDLHDKLKSSPAAMERWIMSSWATNRPIWCGWTFW